LVLMLEWLTLWPVWGPLAVSSQRRDIVQILFHPERLGPFRLHRNGALTSCLTRFLGANRSPLRWKTLCYVAGPNRAPQGVKNRGSFKAFFVPSTLGTKKALKLLVLTRFRLRTVTHFA
jgi:hypothetical protein